ncbi:type II toxin-antitoxin system RelE/ParE family toxin [Serratia ureilytica]
MLNIEWTRAARQDLAEIVGFIANDNPLAARK